MKRTKTIAPLSYPVIPIMKADTRAEKQVFKASAELQLATGYPEELPENWHDIVLEKMRHKLKTSRALRVFMDSCVQCGACTDKCHYFLGGGDPKNMPVARQNLFRSVYKRYFTWPGKLFPWLVGARDLTRSVLDEWFEYFYQCSECRRCSVYCPVGIDTSEVSMAGREILASVGMGQKYTQTVIDKVNTIGNNLGMPQAALKDTLLGLEEDILEEMGVAVELPLDRPNVDILLVVPSADFFAEPHVDGLIGYAKVLHAAGLSWTLSSTASEAANFGLFNGNQEHMQGIAERVRDGAKALGVKRIVFGECGHAWRVAYNYLQDLAGSFDFLDQRYPIPQHIIELTHGLIGEGRLQFDKQRNDDFVVTFHDSCNVARGASFGDKPGGQFTVPREVLHSVCEHVYEMPKSSTHDETFCCGAGGGLLTDEIMPTRIQGALPRMSALQQVINDHGVTHMVAICAICKSQFSSVMPSYGHEIDQVLSLHQLVGNALLLSTPQD